MDKKTMDSDIYAVFPRILQENYAELNDRLSDAC